MFSGKGTFKDLVLDSDKVFNAFKKTSVELPVGVGADVAFFGINSNAGGFGLLLDLTDTPVFSLYNVDYDLPVADSQVELTAAKVEGGVLKIELEYTVA